MKKCNCFAQSFRQLWWKILKKGVNISKGTVNLDKGFRLRRILKQEIMDMMGVVQTTLHHIIDNRRIYQKIKLSDQLRDGFIYTLEIKKQSTKLKFSFDDDSFPKELSGLVEFLLLAE